MTKLMTCHGRTCTVKLDTKRRVAGGTCVDVIVHDEFHPGSRREATVNFDNLQEQP